jgi:hypothetical protein
LVGVTLLAVLDLVRGWARWAGVWESESIGYERGVCKTQELDGRDFRSAMVVQIGIISMENFESLVLHGR